MRYPGVMTSSFSLRDIRGVLFDLDGTLVDSIELTTVSFLHACRVHLGTEPSRAWVAATMGRPLIEALDEAAPGRAAELFATYVAHHDLHHDLLLRPFDEALDAVHALHHRGLPLGIVTSKRRVAALRGLDLYHLTPLFTVVVALEDTARHKPLPDPLLHAARGLDLPPPQLLYIGDSVHDIRAAQAAGMPVAAALWGAGAEAELRALRPDAILARPDDMVRVTSDQ